VPDPFLDEGMVNWIRATARKNHWRVSRWYRYEDLVQDGMMCYARCRARYTQFPTRRPTRSQKKHFMALVKTAFTRHIHNIARKKSTDVLAEDLAAFAWSEALGSSEPDAPLLVLLLQAPKEIKDLFVVLATDTSSFLKIGGVRETTNEHIGRLLGTSPEADYRGDVAKFVTE
jgi:DNA-directed RNA polymerase specialized sigma24 family protein